MDSTSGVESLLFLLDFVKKELGFWIVYYFRKYFKVKNIKKTKGKEEKW